MKKFCLECAVTALALVMLVLLTMIPQGILSALFVLGAELTLGVVVARLYALLEREERRLARRARRDARARHAAQMYRAGVRLGTADPAVRPAARHVPDLRVA